jgi:hypothetical protein
MDNQDILQKVINTLIEQIEAISSKSKMDSNKKVSSINIMEYSSAILHLSKSVGELILIKKALEDGKTKEVYELINGRGR